MGHASRRSQYVLFIRRSRRLQGSCRVTNLKLIMLVNGTYACDNDETMNVILKGQLGFQGLVQRPFFRVQLASHSFVLICLDSL